MYGLAATCYGQTASVWSDPGAVWDYILHGCGPVSTVAPPPAPTGKILTTPPASEADAQATVDALVNEQLRRQQELNAAGVDSSIVDEAASVVVDAGGAIRAAGDAMLSGPGGVSWLVWGGIAAVVGLVAISSGTPRRYGR